MNPEIQMSGDQVEQGAERKARRGATDAQMRRQTAAWEAELNGQGCPVFGGQPMERAAEHLIERVVEPLPVVPLPAESEFYSQYCWCLNSFPDLRATVDHLSQELRKLDWTLENWQRSEVITNIFLLSYSIGDTIDDYLAGNSYQFSKVGEFLSIARPAARAAQKMFDGAARLRAARLARVRRWKETWRRAADEFLKYSLIAADMENAAILLEHRDRLAAMLPPDFPRALWRRRPKVPAFFRSRDFTPFDCFELGRKLVAAFRERERPVLVLGLRTAGSYIAPLIVAYLSVRVLDVDWLAVRPRKGLTPWEKKALRQAAAAKARVIIVDESIHSGETLSRAVSQLREAGVDDRDIVVLNPAEPAFPDWKNSRFFRALAGITIITLEPLERYKQRLLDSNAAAVQLKEYFLSRGYAGVEVATGTQTAVLNHGWRTGVPERVDVRLKRVYELDLEDAKGGHEVRYVLAKSAGWGWFGYHAFLAGEKLEKFVPPLIGLRDGILYVEWIPSEQRPQGSFKERNTLIETIAAYTAARTRGLRMEDDPTPDLGREGRHKGIELLASSMNRIYDSRIASSLSRAWLRRRLSSEPCPMAVMSDSKMSPEEWIPSGAGLLKTDFEHHCHGKNELGITDPAYDLADAIFHFGFSEDESQQLIENYIRESGDTGVRNRLFLHKLLAGMWAQNLATLGLQNPRLHDRRGEFHQQHVASWNFLVGETVRECGKLCRPPAAITWQFPLVSLDIDGVLDRMAFGFPSTTAAGIRAISLFHSHDFAVAVNTARSLREVKEYCRAWHFAGGVAEYGSAIYDATNDRYSVLVSPESMEELDLASRALREIPGVFLNDDYRYSLRAFTYHNGRTAALPPLLVQNLLAGLKLQRLRAHHTGLDTAIIAKEVDKGRGLLALLAFAGLSTGEVLAVGDSEPDLAMFRVASRGFAPANVSCAREARLLGCYISSSPFQPGLLEIARHIVHPQGGECERCKAVPASGRDTSNLFSDLLNAADEKPRRFMMRRLMDGSILEVIRQ